MMIRHSCDSTYRHSAVATAGVLAVCLASSIASGELLVYEGFNYEPGVLNGKDGGLGFAAPWVSEQDPELTVDRTNIVADGLTYTDSKGNQLVVSGGRAVSSGGPVGPLGTGNANAFREITTDSAQVIGITPGTTWWSFIGQRLQPHATLVENTARASGIQIHDPVTRALGFPYPTDERLSVGKGTTDASSDWGMLYDASVANQINSGVPILDTAFIVVRIDHLGTTDLADTGLVENDNAYLWINPDLDQEPQIENADLHFIGLTEFSISRARVFVGNNNGTFAHAEFTWDEYRLATTFEDVAPFVPQLLYGDFNGNGAVENADLTLLLNNWGAAVPPTPAGWTGTPPTPPAIDNDELTMLLNTWGETTIGSGSTTVPEPAAAALATLALAAIVAARRRPTLHTVIA